MPFGLPRSIDATRPAQTDYRYTGQRFEEGLAGGLYDYRSRWYDAYLNRFIQPDTIVPNPGDPRSLNRYSYVNNNALRYTDPTGYYSNDEIQQYLQANYGDSWGEYWDAWQADPYWLSVLHAAEDGYILAIPALGYENSITFYDIAENSGKV